MTAILSREVCFVRAALLVAAAALLLSSPPAAFGGDSTYAIVFYSQRVIWAEDVSINPGHISFISESTGMRYGVPADLIIKVWKFDLLTADAVRQLPELCDDVLLDPSFSPGSINWSGFVPPEVLFDSTEEPEPESALLNKEQP